MQYKKIILLASSTMFLIGGIMGWFGASTYDAYHAPRGTIIREGQDHFINPILSCEIGEKDTFYELGSVKENIEKTINQNIAGKNVAEISVYMRTLNSGRWIWINENLSFAPASLLKVLIMMAYFKEAEKNPLILNQQFLHEGKLRSTEQLVRAMIIDSNNPALYALTEHIDPKAISDVFADLNIPLAQTQREEDLDTVSAKTYSLVFRVLYGASYLSKDMSNKALELLSQTTFREGIAAPLKEKIIVAHKFGARTTIPPEGARKGKESKELHDCGIIYVPNHPYLLCVMTRGDNFENLAKTIADISSVAYQSIEEFFQNQ